MNLIAEFRDFDGDLIDLGEIPVEKALIEGNLISLYGSGTTIARARLELDHNRPQWRVFRGLRGREAGVAVSIRLEL